MSELIDTKETTGDGLKTCTGNGKTGLKRRLSLKQQEKTGKAALKTKGEF